MDCAGRQQKVIPYNMCPICKIVIITADDLVVDEKLYAILTATARPASQKQVLQVCDYIPLVVSY